MRRLKSWKRIKKPNWPMTSASRMFNLPGPRDASYPAGPAFFVTRRTDKSMQAVMVGLLS